MRSRSVLATYGTSGRSRETIVGMQTPTIISGDVIEFDGRAGATTALVLLVSDTTLVLDLLDGTTPRVVKTVELHGVRVFDPADTLLEAA